MPNSQDWRLVRLNFGRTPAHFGEQGIGLEETSERVRSDTLFSALISSYARLYGKTEVEKLLQKFKDEPVPPFRLSSTFIYRRVQAKDKQAKEKQGQEKQGQEKPWKLIYYLPKLLQLPRRYPETDLEFSKTIKSLHYLPLPIWQRWYQGEGFTKADSDQLIAKSQQREAGYKGQLLDREGCFDYKKAFQVNQLPKVAVDRVTHATNFYHSGFVQYAWTATQTTEVQAGRRAASRRGRLAGELVNKSASELARESAPESAPESASGDSGVSLAGLYFLIEFPDLDAGANAGLEPKLQAALNLLGEEGIGGERSSGAGRFQAEWEPLPQEWSNVIQYQGDHYGLISLFWQYPLPPNWLSDSARYNLQERRGWIVSPFSGQQQRRKAVQMFTEGSVFAKRPQGQLADVTPCDERGQRKFQVHSIYRSGIALSLPIQIASESRIGP